MLTLIVTGTHFSVSSGIGFLALFGVSVQTAVLYEMAARPGDHLEV